MEDFFLPEFTLDDMSLDLSIYDESLWSDQEMRQEPPTSREHRVHDDADIKPMKKMKSNGWDSSSITRPSFSSFSSQLISFGFSDVSSRATEHKIIALQHDGGSLRFEQAAAKRGACSSGVRPVALAKEHVLAERKRREKLTERFIALSALLPGLKKSDKATVLGNAIAHLKELQERVRELEEERGESREMESIILVKRSRISMEDESAHWSSSADENLNQELPEIEAKVSREDVLIRIHCEKSKGCMTNILNEIERLHLSVMNSTILPFGDSTLDITVLAKKEEGFSMTVKDLVKNLRLTML